MSRLAGRRGWRGAVLAPFPGALAFLHPVLREWWERNRERFPDLVILCVNVPEEPALVQAYVERT
jgi:hypothetical protein